MSVAATPNPTAATPTGIRESASAPVDASERTVGVVAGGLAAGSVTVATGGVTPREVFDVAGGDDEGDEGTGTVADDEGGNDEDGGEPDGHDDVLLLGTVEGALDGGVVFDDGGAVLVDGVVDAGAVLVDDVLGVDDGGVETVEVLVLVDGEDGGASQSVTVTVRDER